MSDFTLRPAVAADLGPVGAIYAGYVATSVVTFDESAPTAADWRAKFDLLAGRGLPFLVAETPTGALAGFAYAAPWRTKPAYRHTAEVTIYLAPEHTGRGLGRALLAELLTRCAATPGLRQLIAVIAEPGGGASVALHRGLGFTEAGRLTAVGHKHDRWLDTLLLQRDLTAPQA